MLKPRGFCAGVVRAIDVVKIALETFGAPIYVRREIVHNRYVVNELAEKGAIFVHEIDDVPDGQRVIYSAHGVSPAVREISKSRHLRVIDATCPLVTKVHIEAVKFAKQGYSLVLIGHRDHDEIEGTLGEAPEATQVVSNVAEAAALEVPDPNRVAYLTQTTLSLDEARDIIHALKVKFPNIVGPHSQDICYATENRQVAVRNVAHNAGLVLVVGSTNSSNSIQRPSACDAIGLAPALGPAGFHSIGQRGFAALIQHRYRANRHIWRKRMYNPLYTHIIIDLVRTTGLICPEPRIGVEPTIRT